MLTDPVVATFVVLPIGLAVLLVWGVWWAWHRDGDGTAAGRVAARVAVVAAAWLAATWIAAASGVLQQWDRVPPPFAVLVVALVVVAFGLAWSRAGTRLARTVPLWALVAVQGFRFPLEVAMHAMAERGVMPAQMSYSGRNFDIVTGISALVVAALVARGAAGRRTVALWNIVGAGLLLNVVVVAILSTPTFRLFGDDALNTWVADPPFVWLPAVLVVAALSGHILVFRAPAIRRDD